MLIVTKSKIFLAVIFLLNLFYYHRGFGSVCRAVTLFNNVNKAVTIFDFDVIPYYTIFLLHTPERIVIDIWNIPTIKKDILPIKYYNTTNLVQCIRTSSPIEAHSIRIVLDVIYPCDIEIVTYRKIENNCRIILTVSKKKFAEAFHIKICKTIHTIYQSNYIHLNQIVNYLKKILFDQYNKIQCKQNLQKKKCFSVVVVAIDAGHGGQDPGATGYRGIYEKYVNISIAKKLKILLDSNPRFKSVLIRDNDYFLSIMDRSDIARKKGANILISIHSDSSLNANVRGASIWVLSNRRAKSEMMHWLKCSEKHAELLGGVGDILTNYRHTPYLNHVVLDLQFGYSQRVGYEVAIHILNQLRHVSILHKSMPEYSSFGVLCSPDIPSILVETGFISNILDANLLINDKYQEKLAIALYKGLCSYFT